MSENHDYTDDPQEEAGPKAGPRTVTITLPSRGTVIATCLAGILMTGVVLGGVWGYRYLDHRGRLQNARNELAQGFQDASAKAAALLKNSEQSANQLQLDLSAAQKATNSASIAPADLAIRQQGLAQDIGMAQSVLAGLEDREQNAVTRYGLLPQDVLYTETQQDQFNQMQKKLQDLESQQAQLQAALQEVAARKESLAAAERKAAADAATAAAAAKKAAQAKARARSSQNAQVAVFEAPRYPVYSQPVYYSAPAYPVYGGYYYGRPYYGRGYGYGPGWYGPVTSVGFGFCFR